MVSYSTFSRFEMELLISLLSLLPLCARLCCSDKGSFSYVLSSSAVDPVYGVRLDSTVPAVDLALHYINNNSSFLPAINLSYGEIGPLQCPGDGGFLEDALNGANFALLGFSCNDMSTSPITTEMFNITPVIHYTPTSPHTLFNSSTVGSGEQALFSLHPSSSSYAHTLVSILEEFGWQRLLIINSLEEIFFSEVLASATTVFEDANMTLLESNLNETIAGGRDSGNIDIPPDVRIIFLNMNSTSAIEVLCEASMSTTDYFFPRYVWITYEGNYDSLVTSYSSPCERFLEGVWSLLPLVRTENSDVASEIAMGDLENMSPLSYFAFDAVLALAQAVNDTLAGWSNNSPDWSFCEEENSAKMTSLSKCFVRQKIQNLHIDGLTGEISFNPLGDRVINVIGLYQYRLRENSRIPVSELISSITVNASNESALQSEFQLLSGENETTIFGGPVPLDGTPIKNISVQPLAFMIVYYILASLGIVFTIICFLFNIIFRKRKIVKLTSPNLNYFVVLGAAILYSMVYFRVYSTDSELYTKVRCNLQPLFVCVGYVLCFAPVLMKMWRVFYIFYNPLPKKKAVKDWHLFLGTSIIVGVAVFLVVIGYAVPVFLSRPHLKEDVERPGGITEDGITVNNCIYICYGFTASLGWLAVEYVYLLSLQVAAFVLAIITRKVKIKVLNDSKEMFIIVYTSTVIMIVLGIITFALGTRFVLNEILFCGGVMLATTVFLVFVFVPKMIDLYRDPRGEGVFGRRGNTHTTTGTDKNKSGSFMNSNSVTLTMATKIEI